MTLAIAPAQAHTDDQVVAIWLYGVRLKVGGSIVVGA